MKNPEYYINSRQKPNFLSKSLATVAICSTLLGAGATSCGRATEKDVIRQEQKFEIVKNDLKGYINARKEFVKKFNALLAYPAESCNQADINNSLRQLYDVITDYDRKIEKLGKEKIAAENKLNKYIIESSTTGNGIPSTPISENRRDFLLYL